MRRGAKEEFLARPKHERFIVFIAGPAFNVVLAFLAFWMFFGVYGKPVTVQEKYPTVMALSADGAAARSGFLPGDTIISIAGQDVKHSEAFITAYNGWQWALIICQKKQMWTIAVWLYQASTWWRDSPWIVSAGFVVASVPTFLLFVSCQKIILRGIIIPTMK